MRNLKVSILVVAFAALAVALANAQTAGAGNAKPFDRLCSEQAYFWKAREIRRGAGEDPRLDRRTESDLQGVPGRAREIPRGFESQALRQSAGPLHVRGAANFGQSFLEARLEALKAENPKLIAFYNSLDDKQKKTFDAIRERTRH